MGQPVIIIAQGSLLPPRFSFSLDFTFHFDCLSLLIEVEKSAMICTAPSKIGFKLYMHCCLWIHESNQMNTWLMCSRWASTRHSQCFVSQMYDVASFDSLTFFGGKIHPCAAPKGHSKTLLSYAATTKNIQQCISQRSLQTILLVCRRKSQRLYLPFTYSFLHLSMTNCNSINYHGFKKKDDYS